MFSTGFKEEAVMLLDNYRPVDLAVRLGVSARALITWQSELNSGSLRRKTLSTGNIRKDYDLNQEWFALQRIRAEGALLRRARDRKK
jgi:hypothetical protein